MSGNPVSAHGMRHLATVDLAGGGQITVEFVPGLGAHQVDIAANHDRLVDAVVEAAFDNVSRKTLFL
jgi:hypothetical protein